MGALAFAETSAHARRSICLLASFVFSIGAIIFMWFLYPKQYDYKAQLDKGMFFYQANMVRCSRHHKRRLCFVTSRQGLVPHHPFFHRAVFASPSGDASHKLSRH